MEKMLRQLETFSTRGSDGRTYRVHAYEHLARIDLVHDEHAQWEPTGLAEYKLDDGRTVHVGPDGVMTIDGGVTLQR